MGIVDTPDKSNEKDMDSQNLLKFKSSSVKYASMLFGFSKRTMRKNEKRKIQQIHYETKLKGKLWIEKC